jgi:hypothetical protein
MAEGSWFDFQQRSDQLWANGWGALPPGLKWSGREVEHSPPSSAKIENSWIYTSITPCVFMAWCLIKHRDKFTSTLHIHSEPAHCVMCGQTTGNLTIVNFFAMAAKCYTVISLFKETPHLEEVGRSGGEAPCMCHIFAAGWESASQNITRRAVHLRCRLGFNSHDCASLIWCRITQDCKPNVACWSVGVWNVATNPKGITYSQCVSVQGCTSATGINRSLKKTA